ncbi:multicopper oxidase domain-containing protein [Pendulispora brunnea]|uniref:Multicopper oxidase domain-containing protein n=1 Tax=Pendulispora brunnea TaxID=2905690 RepID=A0ABZ2JYB3_9BACT
MNLRTFARISIWASMLGVSFVGCSGSNAEPDESNEPGTRTQAALTEETPFTNPLRIPPVMARSSTAGAAAATLAAYNLTIKTGTAQMRTGNPTPIVGFDGIFPGPTLVVERGETTTVTQTNAWTENVTIHNHGHKVAAESDGHPVDYITPGSSKVYTYPNDQPAGTFWYHDHTMDLTGAHVYNGLAGFYIIHDAAEDALNLPSGNYDIPLLLQDKQFNADNTLTYTSQVGGFLGNTPVVNGVANAVHNVANRKYRLRLLNGSDVRLWNLQLRAGTTPQTFQVISSDGGLLQAPVSTTSLSIAPGERYDIVVDFAPHAVGTSLSLFNTDATAPAISTLMQFTVDRTETDTSAVPSALASIRRYTEAESTGSANITLAFANGNWQLNGLTYDPARIDITSPSNAVRIWTLTNNSGAMHPFHKHLVEFNVLDINGQPPPAHENGLKDTIQVPGRGTVRIIFKNEGFTGTYVFHCHRLGHEDHRMMLQESVTP